MKRKEKKRMIKLRISCLSHWNEGRELLFDPDIGWILSLKKNCLMRNGENLPNAKVFSLFEIKRKTIEDEKKRKHELIKYEF